VLPNPAFKGVEFDTFLHEAGAKNKDKSIKTGKVSKDYLHTTKHGAISPKNYKLQYPFFKLYELRVDK